MKLLSSGLFLRFHGFVEKSLTRIHLSPRGGAPPAAVVKEVAATAPRGGEKSGLCLAIAKTHFRNPWNVGAGASWLLGTVLGQRTGYPWGGELDDLAPGQRGFG